MSDEMSESMIRPLSTQQTNQVAPATTRPTWHGWLFVFLAGAVVYMATASRGTQWQDSGYYILSIYTGQLHNPLGLALTHPVHYALGRLALLIGLVEPSLAITWISSLAAAIAVANVYGCVRCITGNGKAALFAAASLGAAHTFWRLATIAEVYPLTVALLAGECWCLAAFVRKGAGSRILAALALNGLGIANHLQGSLTAPILWAVAIHRTRTKQLSPYHLVAGAILWLIMASPYWLLVVGQLMAGNDWKATLQSAMFGNAGNYAANVLNPFPSLRTLGVCAGFTLLSFPNLFLPAAVYGVVCRQRVGVPPTIFKAFLAGLVIHGLFVVRYNVVDQHTFLLPTYLFLALFAGIGAAGLLQSEIPASRRKWCRTALVLLIVTPVLYELAAPVARKMKILENVARHKPYRDDYVYLFTPWSFADRSADIMAREAVSSAGVDGLIIVEDPMGKDAVSYRALRTGRASLEIKLLSLKKPHASLQYAQEQAAKGRRAVFVPADTRKLLPGGIQAERRGDIYLITGQGAAIR